MNSKSNKFENLIYVPVSWGELFDKISILEIKKDNASNDEVRKNVVKECNLLNDTVSNDFINDPDVKALRLRLKEINQKIWDVEDEIRAKEAAGDFDERFTELARNTYKFNDKRAVIKREINNILYSAIVEEKIY